MNYTRSKRILSVALASAVVLMAAMSQVKCSNTDPSDTGGFDTECYRDLCNDRQFCSDKEKRCKPCLQAHCVNKEYTPKECEPLCPELLNPSTTTASTTTVQITTTTTTSSTTEKPPPEQQTWPLANGNNASAKVTASEEFFIPGVRWSTFTSVLLLVILGLLFVLTVLAIFALRNQMDIRRRLPHWHGVAEEGRTLARIHTDEQPLLNHEWERRGTAKTNGSAHAMSSRPFRPTRSGPQQHEPGTGNGSPTYIAPASSGEEPVGSEQQGNNYLHELVTNNG